MSIAIDIGTRAMHLVEGKARGNRVDIKRAIIEPLASGLVQDGIIREMGGMEVAFRNMLKKHGIFDRSCILTINGNHIYTRELVVPRGKPKVMHDVVAFEVQSSMGANKEMATEFIVSKQPVLDRTDVVNVRASAVQLEIINDYHKLLKNCHVVPVALDIHANAMAKALVGREINGKPMKDGLATLVLDIGGVTSSAYIFRNGEVIYSRIIPIGGLEIERYIQQFNEKQTGGQQIMIEKVDLSLDSVRKNTELADAVRPIVSTINDGIQRLIQYMGSRMQNERVNQIYLCGRTATFSGLDRTLSDTFGIQTETIIKISQVNLPANISVAPFVNAIGALIRLD